MKKQKKITIGIVLLLTICYGIQVIVTKWHTSERIVILGYHHIVPDKDKEKYYQHNMWVASLSSFEQQMELLHKEGYRSITLDELYAWTQGKRTLDEKTVVITFDDGFYSSTKFAKPILEKYNFQGSVFVIGSQIDEAHGPYDPSLRQHASQKDMKDQRILSYYAHSYDLHHKKDGTFKVDTVTEEALIWDTAKEKKLVSTTYYAYPYGKYNDTIKSVLKQQGTKLAFGYNENRKVDQHDDLYALPRFNINAYTKLDVFKTMLESR